MSGMRSYIGVALILVGALLLIVGYIAGWTSSNLVLLAGLLPLQRKLSTSSTFRPVLSDRAKLLHLSR